MVMEAASGRTGRDLDPDEEAAIGRAAELDPATGAAIGRGTGTTDGTGAGRARTRARTALGRARPDGGTARGFLGIGGRACRISGGRSLGTADLEAGAFGMGPRAKRTGAGGSGSVSVGGGLWGSSTSMTSLVGVLGSSAKTLYRSQEGTSSD